ncbi:MAG: hypothetical protein EBX52_02380 [Proteobacteria bacterium]|nr:hypothetical protein [Pseudomonadota bacterium]
MIFFVFLYIGGATFFHLPKVAKKVLLAVIACFFPVKIGLVKFFAGYFAKVFYPVDLVKYQNLVIEIV